MVRKTFFALVALLATATASHAAIILDQSLSAVQPGGGLVAYDLRAVSDSGQTINTVDSPSIVPNGGSGLHQVWTPIVDGPTPTRAQHSPPLWNDIWRAWDSYFLFDAANSLGVGGEFTETNNHAGGAALPNAGFGAPNTGFGGIGSPAGASKLFTVASGIPDSDVTFAQLVMKEGESVLVSMGVFDNQGSRTGFQGVCIGACGPPPAPPVADDLALLNLDTTVTPIAMGTTTVSSGDPPITFGGLSFLSYTATNSGVDDGNGGAGASLASDGSFSFPIQGRARGEYRFSYTATNAVGSDLGEILVEIQNVPEPSTLALLGLAIVGSLGLIRRRG